MKIKQWCKDEIIPYTGGKHTVSSYRLKHCCESAIGEYVPSEQFVAALDELGVHGRKVGINRTYSLKRRF